MAKMEFIRATAEISNDCGLCYERTNRIFAFKKPGELRLQSVFICDDCAEGMKNAPSRRPAEG